MLCTLMRPDQEVNMSTSVNVSRNTQRDLFQRMWVSVLFDSSVLFNLFNRLSPESMSSRKSWTLSLKSLFHHNTTKYSFLFQISRRVADHTEKQPSFSAFFVYKAACEALSSVRLTLITIRLEHSWSILSDNKDHSDHFRVMFWTLCTKGSLSKKMEVDSQHRAECFLPQASFDFIITLI